VTHVILLGDSIFDNARYVPGGPAAVEQLRAKLPAGGRATLCAVDGAVARGVAGQLSRLPADATHLVVSTGGNDALAHSGLLRRTDISATAGFAGLADAQAEFRRDYAAMLRSVLARKLPTVLCTVYDAIPGLPREAVTALATFNDVIVRAAADGLPVLDLRAVCSDAADYSAVSPIEPSVAGGDKIAAAVAGVVARHDFTRRECVVYSR
jgi:hypothetical protein